MLLSAVAIAAAVLAAAWGQAFASPGGAVTVQSLALADTAGNSLTQIRAGSQFIVTVTVVNGASGQSQYAAVLEARDSDGVTRWLETSTGTLEPGQVMTISRILLLDEPGSYTFRSFTIDSVKSPTAFSPVVVVSAPVARVDYPGVYVPLYKYPDLWKPDGVWNTLSQAKQTTPSVLFVVTVNPSSGPGDRQNPAHVHAISELKKSGVEYILGYVPTNYAQQNPSRTLDDLKAMVDRYRAWYPEVNGIMLDQTSSSEEALPFYKELVKYSRSQGMEFVRANPGTKPAEAYLDVFDNLAIYEGDSLPTATQLQENTYFPRYLPENFSFVSKNVDSLDLAQVALLRDHVGLLYVTDDVESESDRNPYNSLPRYFADLVRLLAVQLVEQV